MAYFMHFLANPNKFLKLAGTLEPWIRGLCISSFILGLPLALIFSPPDYQQGDTVRIMYIHVPAAWMGLFCYLTMAIASICFLVWRHPVANMITRASAPIGAAFTTICLLTGMLWGKPMWGTAWVWDARLTSMLVLLFLYLGYMALTEAFENPTHSDQAGAILILIGTVNLPIIKFSVDWWNTLHQPSIFSMSGISVSNAMLPALLVMTIAFKSYFLTTLIIKIRTQMLQAKIRATLIKQGN
jgi:heme exporter protein C